jgi:hypothetical protein
VAVDGLQFTVEKKADPSLRSEDVIKLPKGDFFVPKLLVFSITFGRKTKSHSLSG